MSSVHQDASATEARVVSVAAGGRSLFALPGHLFDDLAQVALACFAVIVVLTYGDYGITHDEPVQNAYGKMLLSYYATGFEDRSAFAYLDLYRYGGLFDILAALLNAVSPLGEYETRHLLGGLFGLAGLAGAWRLARLVGGERAGFLALLLLLLTPSYYGHSFNNPKDGPFAAAMVWTLYATCLVLRELPVPRRATVLKFGLALGLALAIRVGALLALVYLGLGGLMYLVARRRETAAWRSLAAEAGRAAFRLLPGFALAYLVMAAFWPWAYQSPLNPIRTLVEFSHVNLAIDTWVAGEQVKSNDLPAYYLPVYLAVKLPEVVLAGLAAAAGLAVAWMAHGRRRRPTADHARTRELVVVAAAAFLPVVACALLRPTLYNGLRHFLFVVPPMAVLAALALDRLWMRAEARATRLGRAFAFALAIVLAVQGWVMTTLHPHQYVYFNLLAGGLKGAQGDFEMDYWSNSLKGATEDLARFLEMENDDSPPAQTYRVFICGHPLSASYFFPPFLALTKNLKEADFVVSFTQTNCHKHYEGREIIAVERFGVALSVVKDRRAIPQRSEFR
jgi:hypothetical protein